MKNFVKTLVLGAAIVASAPFAKADAINQISFSGSTVFTPSNMLSFTNPLVTGTSTGIFAPFVASTFNPFSQNTTVTFNSFTAGVTNNFVLFNATAPNGETVAFQVTSDNLIKTAGGALDVSGSGIYTFVTNGVTSIRNGGTFDLTAQGAVGSNVSFSDTNSVTPEPSSLLLLGTGLVSAAGMLIRRRRIVVA